MGTLLRMMHSRSAEYAADADHASHGYLTANDALTIGGVRGRRVREEHRRGSGSGFRAGETGGDPRDGEKARREDPRPRVERVRGVVHRQPAGTRFVVTHDGRVAADAPAEPGPHRAVARLVILPNFP